MYMYQGGHALWKTGKMVKKNSLQGKIREFEILLKIREKSGNFKKSYLCKVKIFKFYSCSAVIFLTASPASYTHNLVSETHKIYMCESLNSQNTIENCSKICKGLLILSWDSLNINHVSPLDSVESKGK